MAGFEYKVVPAPTKGTKAKGVKTAEDRFALTLEETINAVAAEGWEYRRSETLPSVERSGLTGSTTNWRHILVFRRTLEDDMSAVIGEPDTTASDEPEGLVEDNADPVEEAEEITLSEPETANDAPNSTDKPLVATRSSDV